MPAPAHTPMLVSPVPGWEFHLGRVDGQGMFVVRIIVAPYPVRPGDVAPVTHRFPTTANDAQALNDLMRHMIAGA